MLHILPFMAGAVIGAGVVALLKSKSAKDKFLSGKDFVNEKIEDGVDTIKAVSECIKDKKESIKEVKIDE
jgi:hypothetical protein